MKKYFYYKWNEKMLMDRPAYYFYFQLLFFFQFVIPFHRKGARTLKTQIFLSLNVQT